MSREKKINLKLLISLFTFIFIFFAGFILLNEYTLISGEKVYLKTVPIDPRDLLRGDYVILDYEISQDEKIKNLIKEENLSKGTSLYLILNKDENGFANLKKVSLHEPENELFIKANLEKISFGRSNLELGIGKYFIPENRGREVERLRGDLDILVSIDNRGSAKIVDLYYNGSKIDFKNEKIS